jgi:hypothetical protein
MSLSKQEFTNAGRSMLGRAQNGETLTVTHIVVGDGNASQPSDLWPLTALIDTKLNVTISTKIDYGDGTLLVEGSFTSDAATAPFYLREVGVLAHIGAEADRLYSVANVFADPPDYIDPAAPTVQAFKIKLVIDRIPTASLIVQIGPSENVLGENIGDASTGPGPYKDAAGNVLRFKRFVAGVGIELIEAPAPEDGADTIEVRAKQLVTNVDLYVPATYPGITDPSVLFATIQDAHDYLLQFHIPADKLATIHVYSGHFAQTIPIVFSHPDSDRIQLIGLDVTTKACSGSVNRSGSLPNVDVTVQPANTSGIAVNDVVYLYDAPHAQFEGCGVVTLIAGPLVTIRMHIANVLPPASTPVLATTKLILFPTQEISSLTAGALFSCPNGINLIKNFALRSTAAQQATAVNISGTGGLELVSAVSFQLGFGITGGIVTLAPVVSANDCQNGIEVGPSGTAQLLAPTSYARVTFSGNWLYGIWVVGGSYISSVGGVATYACSNGTTGIRSDTRGFVGVANTGSAAGGYVIAYNQRGLSAVMLGIILSSIDVGSVIALNTTWDLIAAQGGQISIVHNSTISGLYSPALNLLGPSGGFNAMSL